MNDPLETVEYCSPGAESKLVQRDVSSGDWAECQPRRLGPFDLVRPIGSGGMSLVFEAIDTRSGQSLALKMLYTHGQAAIQRLKREFRAIADIHHPNLVQLHELIVDGDQPFFTMELISGSSMLEYLRADGAPVQSRIEQTFCQLVDAVSTLHAGGVLHRDLKPANILVQPNGRVVVLDFGLARALADQASGLGSGTPAYMAPERLLGDVSTEPSDWFSVGVILWEVLTGELPSSRALDRPVPRAVPNTAWSIDLIALCRDLLSLDPARRPNGRQLRALFALPPSPEASSLVQPPAENGLLVGRGSERAWLANAYIRARCGDVVVAHVHGEPGIGKTALVKHFLRQVQAQHEVLVLESRCYEHELIPYNAVDGLIDGLALYLEGLRRSESPVPSPDGTAELAKLFPALAKTLINENTANDLQASLDPQHLRQRAFAALCALLREASARQSVVIHLDDLQWGDADCAQLLAQILRESAGMRMLIIASYRTADADGGVCIRALQGGTTQDSAPRRQLCLGALQASTALDLARAFGGDHLEDEELQALARESRGSPLFLKALVQHSCVLSANRQTTLEELLCRALDRLPTSTRKLLDLVALAARPLPREVLMRAAQSDGSDSVGVDRLIALQRGGFLRAVTETHNSALDTYHDRVREIVTTTMDSVARRRYHAQLAAAEAASASPDAEFLAYQYEHAAQPAAAAHYAELAGDRAIATFALERAVQLYELALRCLDGKRPTTLLEKLANASAYVGRCAQAAPLYLEVASAVESDQPRARRLLLRATEMFLRRGKVAESVSTVRPVLRTLGIHYPAFAPSAVLSIIIDMTRLRLGGARPKPAKRPSTELENLRHELCFVLGYRLTLIDPLAGSALLLRGLALTLRSGTEAEVARALACYAWILATLGWSSNEEQDRLLAQAGALAQNAESADAKGWTLYSHGMTLYTRGHFHAALALLDQAHTWVATKCTDSGWLLAEIELFICAQHVAKGEVTRLRLASEPILRRLNDSGNEFQSAALTALRSQIALAQDRPDIALRDLNEILTTWKLYATAIITVWSKVNTLMYQGEPHAAWQTMQQHWPEFGRAGYRRVNPWSVALPLLEATVALACAHQDHTNARPKYLIAVRRGLRWLKRQKADWARPSWLLLQAGLSKLCGDRAAAERFYNASAEGYEQLQMLGYASIARMRQAEIMEGAEAARLREQAERWFSDQAIVRPASWMRMYAPITSE